MAFTARLIRAIAGLAVALGLVAPAQAPAQADAEADALAATRAIFYHELGHALVDLLDLDVVGPEETVVDEFSTLLLILESRRDGAGHGALLAAARFWYLAAEPEVESATYWQTHDFSRRRGFAIVCLMYGSDPDRFHAVMGELGVAEDRREACVREYREKSENWVNLLSPHLSGQAPAARTGRVRPVYRPGAAAQTWRGARLLERLAAEANRLFPLPRDIALEARPCGSANAFWDGARIVLCYELHGLMVELFSSAPGAAARPAEARPGAGAGAVNVGSLLGSGE